MTIQFLTKQFFPYFKTPEGGRNLIDIGSHVFDWMSRFGIMVDRSQNACSTLKQASSAFSVINLTLQGTTIVKEVRSEGVLAFSSSRKTWNAIFLGIADGATLWGFLGSLGIVKERARVVNGLSWAAMTFYQYRRANEVAGYWVNACLELGYRSENQKAKEEVRLAEVRLGSYILSTIHTQISSIGQWVGRPYDSELPMLALSTASLSLNVFGDLFLERNDNA